MEAGLGWACSLAPCPPPTHPHSQGYMTCVPWERSCLNTQRGGEPSPPPTSNTEGLSTPLPLQNSKTKVSLIHLQLYSRAEISHFLTINIKK